MTIRHLHIFIAVAETGSMSAAAKRLFISQPTVSQVIAEMEENGIPTRGNPDVERDRRRAEHWETIGIGLPGYYP